jgi:deazaflavin-dependent oxidoreductase (nitroreductase family)
MDEAVQRALENDRTIDISTTGRRSGKPRRLEIWRYRYDGRTFLSGSPGTRAWYANLIANPEFTFHLKGSVQADLPAVARPITDEEERREVIAGILEDLGRGSGNLEEWVESSPLVEVEFLDQPPG